MIPSLSFSRTVALAAAGGLALAPVALAQESPAPSDQAVRDEVVQGAPGDRHLAPHDTFYTTEYASVRTDKGVEGFPPGTEVRLVSVNREARTLTVTDGRANIELPPEKLTNDLDIAAAVRAQDAVAQERVARYRQAEAEAYAKYQKAVADYTAQDLAKRQEAIRDANERLQEQAANSAGTQSAATTGASFNSYYNQGGYGYGSPYGYFVDLNAPATIVQPNARANAAGSQTSTTTPNGSNGNGAISSTQNGTQSGNAQTGRTSTGSAPAGGGSAGGKKP